MTSTELYHRTYRREFDVCSRTDAPVGTLTWDDIAHRYAMLECAPLPNDDAIEEWLDAWTILEEQVEEADMLAHIAFTADTNRSEHQETQRRFATEIIPATRRASAGLAKRLLNSGFTRPNLVTPLARLRVDIELTNERTAELQGAVGELETQYYTKLSGMTVQWDGTTQTLSQLNPILRQSDRGRREQAFRATYGACIEHRDVFAGIFTKMIDLRQQLARAAGCTDYREYVFLAKHREYTPADCEDMHRAIEHVLVPVTARILERRRLQLGIDHLRPWDEDVLLSTGDRPVITGDVLVQRARTMLAHVSPRISRVFGRLVDTHMIDVESRVGKSPGAYCAGLPVHGRAYIHMNLTGAHDDVRYLMHEIGHANHYVVANKLRWYWERWLGEEIAEFASTSMELLMLPYLNGTDGLFSETTARDVTRDTFERLLLLLPFCAQIDAFQHWIYTDPAGRDGDARDAKWLELHQRFFPGSMWDGLTSECASRWYRVRHIFLYPFYYLEYALAAVGALQVWRNSRHDLNGTIRQYEHTLALGGTRPQRELYRHAGAELVFDEPLLRDLLAAVNDHLCDGEAS